VNFRSVLTLFQTEIVKGKFTKRCLLDSLLPLQRWHIPSPTQPLFYRFFHVSILFLATNQENNLIFRGQSNFHNFFLHPPILNLHSFVTTALYTFFTVSCHELSPLVHIKTSERSRSWIPDPIKFLLYFSHSVAKSPSSPKAELSNQFECIVRCV